MFASVAFNCPSRSFILGLNIQFVGGNRTRIVDVNIKITKNKFKCSSHLLFLLRRSPFGGGWGMIEFNSASLIFRFFSICSQSLFFWLIFVRTGSTSSLSFPTSRSCQPSSTCIQGYYTHRIQKPRAMVCK